MNDKVERTEISIVASQHYRAAAVDGAVVTMARDEVGTMMEVNLTRGSAVPISETVTKTEQGEGEGVRVAGTGEVTVAPFQKINEFTAVIRPDKAFAIAFTIIENLSKLDEKQRLRYNLPKMNLQAGPIEAGAEEATTGPVRADTQGKADD